MLTRPVVRVVAAATLLVAALLLLDPAPAAQNAYTLFTTDGRRSIPFRTSGNTDLVALEPLTGLFGLSITEDAGVGGLIIGTRGLRIIALPGQSFVRVGERVVSLSGPIQRERNAWWVPVDFLSMALGPAIGQRVEVRKAARLILMGDVRVPRISGQVDRLQTGARLSLDVQPAVPHRVARDGNRLTIRFDAPLIDTSPVSTSAPDFVSAVRFEGTSVILDLGSAAAQYRVDADPKTGHIQVDLLPANAPPPKPVPPPPVTPTLPPPVSTTPSAPPPPPPPSGDPSGLRTIVIDPGHGGDDEGARGPDGTKEKDLALALARRLKGAIESRMGLRVLLTRDADDTVAIDRRTSVANNNKADLFISLHANASVRPAVQGAQVLSLAVEDYGTRVQSVGRGVPVPVVGNTTRLITTVPWDLAQIPFAPRSAAVAALVVEKLRERQVPLHTVPAAQAPMRVLVGANMPASLVETGFLTNPDDERALSSADRQDAIVEALFDAISVIRRGLPATAPTIVR